MRTKSNKLVVAGVVLVVVLSACSGDDDSAETDDTSESSAAGDAVESSEPTEAAVTTTTTGPAEPVATPASVDGPVVGDGVPANTALQDLDAVGYVEEEYFIAGEAQAYEMVGERTTDGEWDTAPAEVADYKTRMLVRRPADPQDFSGTVVVEWLNVSAGFDADPDWGYTHDELLREGHVWVGVSAQEVGVVGGGSIVDAEVDVGGDPRVAGEGGLVGSDPQRYGTLVHPGDEFSFDIFTQAGAALVDPEGTDPLGGLVPDQVIAAGESQSAFFLTTYLNGVHPHVQFYDGFLVHSRGGGAPGLQGEGLGDSEAVARPVQIRNDLDVPVLIFETETDLIALDYVSARQPDSELIRVWEVAGTAHADSYLLEESYGVPGGVDISEILGCSTAFNAGPHHEVLQAALHALVEWVRAGAPPPEAPRLEIVEGDEPAIARDDYGNALGGIRTPPVDVPVATLSGDPADEGGGFCFLFGSTTPFDDATLAELYPTHQDYVDRFTGAANAAVDAGFLLRADADAMIAEAVASQVGAQAG